MLAILREISVTCFFTSYLVVLVLELLRLAGKMPGRALAVIAMSTIGLFTHITYLVLRTTTVPGGSEIGFLATWHDWSLLLALGLAICFLFNYVRRPDTVVSFFFLPVVLGLIGLGVAIRDTQPFSRSEAAGVWRSVHGLAMMVGAGAVLIGFLVGIMYLIQSRRLKQKRAGSGLRLPTLETLGRMNRRCLITSTVAVGIGVFAGAIMNINQWGSVSWTEGGVLFSVLLFAWLLVTTGLEYLYASASHGTRAVYLTLASLGFLILAMIGVMSSPHGKSDGTETSATDQNNSAMRIHLATSESGDAS